MVVRHRPGMVLWLHLRQTAKAKSESFTRRHLQLVVRTMASRAFVFRTARTFTLDIFAIPTETRLLCSAIAQTNRAATTKCSTLPTFVHRPASETLASSQTFKRSDLAKPKTVDVSCEIEPTMLTLGFRRLATHACTRFLNATLWQRNSVSIT